MVWQRLHTAGREHVARSALVLVVYAGLVGFTGYGLATSPTGFIPEQDQGYLLVNVNLPEAASVQRTADLWKK